MRQPIVFGKYLLLERISVGGMAEVFKAKYFGEEGFEKILAIKRILPSMMEDDQFIRMFVDEAKIAGELSHPNIGQIFELGKIEDVHFIAMEFVWGKDVLQIQNRIRRLRQKMPLDMAAYIASRVCEGLDYAHHKTDAGGREMHIIHRDVSPQNILVSYSGEVKIIDFGIAKARSRSSKTQAGVLKGKFGYMSPEQVRGMTLDQRSDIFSIGTLLYEMVTGERLFTGETDFATLDKVRNADVIPPSQVNPAVPPELDTIIMHALRREPDERYQWASDMQEDLAAYVRAGTPIFSSKPLGGGVRKMFDAERKREMSRLEEYNKIKKGEMDNFSRPPDAGHGEMVMSLLPLEPVQGEQDPSLAARPEDEMEGEATVVGGMPGFGMDGMGENDPTPVVPEVQAVVPFQGDNEGATQIFSAGDGPNLGMDNGPMDSESTYIFDSGGDPGGALAMADESTVIFGGGGDNGHGAHALADDEVPDQGSTVLFDTTGGEQRAAAMGMDLSAFPADEATATPGHISGTVPVQIETSRPSSLIKDILIGVLVALVVILVVVIWRLFASGGLASSNPATLVITATPPQAAVVLVDGQRKGAMVPGNPFTLKDVSPQEHVITLKRVNLPDVKRTVTLEPGDVKVLSIALAATALSKAANKPAPVLKPKATPVVESKPDAAPPDVGDPAAVAAAKPEPAAAAKPEPAAAAKPEPAPAPKPEPKVAAAVTKPAPKPVVAAKPASKPRQKPVTKPVTKPAPKPEPKVAANPVGKPVILRPNATKDPFGGSAAKPKGAVAKPKPTAKPKPRSKPKVITASTRGMGFLVANTKPWAKVFVDGKNTGKTTPILPRAKISLKPGSHKVTFEVDGKKFHYNVKIVAGETARLIKKLPLD